MGVEIVSQLPDILVYFHHCSPYTLYTVHFQFSGHSLDLLDNVLYDWLFPHHCPSRLHSSLFWPDGAVNYDYIVHVTNSINTLLIGSSQDVFPMAHTLTIIEPQHDVHVSTV